MYLDHPDPAARRWRQKYPRFPGVAECVRLIKDGKSRGSWAEIIVNELAENVADCLVDLIEAFRSESNGDVQLYVVMALDLARVPASVPFLEETLAQGDPRLVPYVESALRGIDTPESRTALWNHRHAGAAGARKFEGS